MSTLQIRRLQSSEPNFSEQLKALLEGRSDSDTDVAKVVADIIADIRKRKDQALIEYTQRFDQLTVSNVAELEISLERLSEALDSLPREQRDALEIAAMRIQDYAEKQKMESWTFTDTMGNRLGQKVTPLASVGLYVPGGKAAYPSSVLMNAIPAKVAGVEELVMVAPAPKGEINSLVLAAAALAGVSRVYTIGGAQAVAALAYGTETICAVEKIVGPGNIFVATAKQMVFGQVGIDMIAGPSEIAIVSDGSGNPDWIAMDLFSQAEHDEEAQSILISPDKAFLDKVEQSILQLLPSLERKEIVTTSLQNRGALIHVTDMEQAFAVANRIAPEHLELAFDNAADVLDKIKNAGAIFLGHYSAEALGDYVSGPNHVLPTAGTARFASPLGVYDFQKRSSIMECSIQGAAEIAKTAELLAECEGLQAHARSAAYRG